MQELLEVGYLVEVNFRPDKRDIWGVGVECLET